jgi:hypothetical protein
MFPANITREFAYDATGRMRQVKHNGVVAMDYLFAQVVPGD